MLKYIVNPLAVHSVETVIAECSHDAAHNDNIIGFYWSFGTQPRQFWGYLTGGGGGTGAGGRGDGGVRVDVNEHG